MISLRPELLKRYRDIVLLLFRHVDKDMLQHSGLTDVFDESEKRAASEQETSAPEELAKDLEAMGPTFVKLGQLLSTRPDILPEPYLEALARLQDDVEPFPYEDIERIVTEELGVKISQAFSRFDSRPLAAASLAQVHRAAMRDGREVVVKVQRPNIRGEVALDLEALGEVAKLVSGFSETARRYRLEEIVQEFRQTLTRELDLQREAGNLKRMAATLKDFKQIRVPQPVDDFTTSKVLTMEYLEGNNIGSLNPVVHTDLPGRELAEELFKAYLYQVLVAGFFHADPHPGNVLLTHDHHIALLDLGMVGHVPLDLQQRLLRLLLAISEGDGSRAADIALAIASRAETCDEKAFQGRIADLIAAYGGTDLQEIQIGRLLMAVCRIAAENGILMPSSLSVLAKTMLNLDQIGVALDPTFNPNAAIKRYADELMRDKLRKEASKENLLASLWEVKDLIEALPARANKILETLANNELKVEVDAIDEERLTSSVEKVANRITMGLLLAALIVGASMLMSIETPFTILGYPGLAITFFLAAAGGALWLVWKIVQEDRKGSR